LWPLSTEERPKQFVPLLSSESLLAQTYERVAPLAEEIFVATAERHAALVKKQLRGFSSKRILTEPSRRNSGPAILSAALLFEEEGDRVTAAIPSDQAAADAEAFRRAITTAAKAADAASVVLLAVPPTRPETDFGYLEMSPEIAGEASEVVRFIEKPGPAEAESYVQSGFLWNAGIFVFRPSRLLAEARRIAGDLMAQVEAYRDALGKGRQKLAVEIYASLPSISIDYGVLEKASHVRAVPLRAGWSDVGTWRSVRDLRGPSDDRGNLIVSEKPVLAPGVRQTAIVCSEDGVLVLPFDRESELKGAVEKMATRSLAPSPKTLPAGAGDRKSGKANR